MMFKEKRSNVLEILNETFKQTPPPPTETSCEEDTAHLTERQVMVFLLEEVYVPGGDDADQAAAHLAVVCDGDAAEAVPGLGLENILHTGARAHDHRVCDEALFIPLVEKGARGIGSGQEGTS